jgi:acylglycerol lipase
MGGNEALYFAAEGDEGVRKHIRGYLLEAPFIAFHPNSKPSPITVVLGRMAGKLLPHHQMLNAIDPKLLSRDPEVQQAFVDDQLCHDTGTLEGLASLLDRASALDSGKVRVSKTAGEGDKTRIWFSHGTGDGVCDYEGSKRVYEKAKGDGVEDVELKLYDGWFHKRTL